MSYPALLEHLSTTLGLSGLPLDDQHSCALRLDEGLELNFRWLPDEEALMLFSTLGQVGLQHRAAVLAELMRANRFWQGTGGATLSLDDNEPPQVVLAQRIEARHVSPADFMQTLEWFTHAALGWQSQLNPMPADEARAPDPIPAHLAAFSFA